MIEGPAVRWGAAIVGHGDCVGAPDHPSEVRTGIEDDVACEAVGIDLYIMSAVEADTGGGGEHDSDRGWLERRGAKDVEGVA